MNSELILKDLNKIDCSFLKFIDSRPKNSPENCVQFDCVLKINPYVETSIFTYKDSYFEHIHTVFSKYGLKPSFNNTKSCFWAFF